MTENVDINLDDFEEINVTPSKLFDLSELCAVLSLDKIDEIMKSKDSKSLDEAFGGELPVSTFENPDSRSFAFNIFGDFLTLRFHFCKIGGSLYGYDEASGIYRSDEYFLHGLMLKVIPSLTDTRRKEVLKYLRCSLKTPERELAEPRYIPFKSLIYDIVDDEYIPYSHEWVFTCKFNVDYIPNQVRQVKVEQMIKDIGDNDEDITELIYEAIGSCFYLTNVYRGSFLFYSPSGQNGKSTLLNLIAQVIGRDNIAHLSLSDTAERFRLAELQGKAANIGDDISSNFLPDTSTLKKIITGEPVIAERKGQDPISFAPYCKLFFALNGLPPVADRSRAFFSRVLIIPLTADFSGQNKDVSLKNRRWTDDELNYIATLSVEALKRLIARGDYIHPAKVIEATRDFEESNNPILQFVEDFDEPIAGLPTGYVYSQFKLFCEDNGQKGILSQRRFTAEICTELNLTIKSGRHQKLAGKVGRLFVEK